MVERLACLYEPKTCSGLRGEARLKGLRKLQEGNKVVNTLILLLIERFFFFIPIVLLPRNHIVQVAGFKKLEPTHKSLSLVLKLAEVRFRMRSVLFLKRFILWKIFQT